MGIKQISQPTKDRISRTKEWVQKNERLVTSTAFLGGFGVDLLTLNRIDQWFDNAVLLTYMVLAAIAILVINTDIEEQFGSVLINRLSPLALYLAQFAFGGLLSGFVIFYTKSASWYVSWPFLVGLYIMFLANDRIRKYYSRLEVQTAMLFGAIMAMSIFFVPTMLRLVGDFIFILSGIVSIVIILIFLKFLYWLLPTISPIRRWRVRRNIFFIFTIFNILYFTNVIPPIPLSLKHGDIYHSIVRSSEDSYTITYEKYPWYDLAQHTYKNDYHKTSPTDRVFALVSIFAPDRLQADIYHKWQWFNPKTEQWKDVIDINYTMIGGRDGGFRWYSFVTDPEPGQWRIRVTASHDKEIGRILFTVINDGTTPVLTTKEI